MEVYTVTLYKFRVPEESEFVPKAYHIFKEEYLYDFDEKTGNILIVRKCIKCNKFREIHDFGCPNYEINYGDITFNHLHLDCEICRGANITIPIERKDDD